jgi:hypothetical protein
MKFYGRVIRGRAYVMAKGSWYPLTLIAKFQK